jgi:hypothetical protein
VSSRPIPLLLAAALSSALLSCAESSGRAGPTQPSTVAPPTTRSAQLVGAPSEASCSEVRPRAERDLPGTPPSPAPCDGPHGSETWRVVALPESWGASSPRPTPGSAEEGELARLADERCPEADWRRYANLPVAAAAPAGVRALPTSLRARWYLPSAEQWSGGVRWIRCDLGVDWPDATPAEVGWTGTIVELRDPRSRLLLSTDCWQAGEQPEAAENQPCGRPHDVEVASVHRVDGDRPDGTDGAWKRTCEADVAAYLGVRSATEGTPAHHVEVIVQPSGVDDWAAGERTVACRLSYRRRADGQRVQLTEPVVGLGLTDPGTAAGP